MKRVFLFRSGKSIVVNAEIHRAYSRLYYGIEQAFRTHNMYFIKMFPFDKSC